MHRITVLGKIPPPYIGPSVWFDTMMKSRLNEVFEINWFNVNIHKGFEDIGRKRIQNVISNIRLYVKFYFLLKKFKPELVLIPISQTSVGFIKDSVFIRLASRTSGIVTMLHGSNLCNWLNQSSLLLNKYFAATIKKSRGAIVLGHKLRYLFTPWLPENRIYSIYNGISFKSLPSKNMGSGKIVLRYIGNIIKAKGILEILQAIRILNREYKNFELILNGAWHDPRFNEECQDMINKNDLPVRYDGLITGDLKIKAFSETDIFIFTPNKPEGLPLVIIEAMAAGIPIISTDQGAISEAVKDNINGFIVDAGSPEQIAVKIKFLIDNPGIRIEMGHAGRRLHSEYFTEKKMIDSYIAVFTELLDQIEKESA